MDIKEKVGDKIEFKHILSTKKFEGIIKSEYKNYYWIVDCGGKDKMVCVAKNDRTIKKLNESINKQTQMKKVFKLSDALKKIKEIEEKTGKKFLAEGLDFANLCTPPKELKEGEDSFDAKKMSLTEEESFDAKKLTEEDSFDAQPLKEGDANFDPKKMSLTEEATTADIAVPETPIDMKKMKPASKMSTDVDYLTEDIPATKQQGPESEGFQKVKSLCSQLKYHIEKSTIETTKGTVESFAVTFPKKLTIPFNFAKKLDMLGYMIVVDSLAKVKVHIVAKPTTK